MRFYSEPTNLPFLWSNGVIEVPMTEKILPKVGKDEWWARLTYPGRHTSTSIHGGKLLFNAFSGSGSIDFPFALLVSSVLGRERACHLSG